MFMMTLKFLRQLLNLMLVLVLTSACESPFSDTSLTEDTFIGNPSTGGGNQTPTPDIGEIPTVSFTSVPAINPSNLDSYTLSGTCSDDGFSVTVNVGEASAVTTCSGGVWSSTLDIFEVTDGSVVITAEHINADGNNARTSTSQAKQVAILIVDNVTGDNHIDNTEDDSDVTVTGRSSGIEDGQNVTVSLNGTDYVTTVSDNAWSVDIPAVDAQSLLGDFSGNNFTSVISITTDVTSWYSGDTSANLGRMIDGNISTSGANDYQVHPSSADGKYINFDLGGAVTGGNFLFYNRTGCCTDRIEDSDVSFYLDGVLVASNTITTSVAIITIAAPATPYDEIVLTFDGSSQNFREIEVVPTAYHMTINATDADANNADEVTKSITHD